MNKVDYKSSGVNIAAGEDAVSLIKPLVKSTFNKHVLSHIGGFGGLYQVDLSLWKEPVLVSSADGVGTKILVAQMAGVYDTVGQDLVNHCVDDIFVQGAIPQYFLDYIGVGRLDPQIIADIIKGFTIACKENGMALIGGEMAEMPGIYRPNDFDLAGTITGLIEKKNIITGEAIRADDVIIGFASTGLHTNGYSLARKVIFDIAKLSIDSLIPNMNVTVAEALLAVHPSYYPVLKKWANPTAIHGMAHITGGGIPGNLKRSIPDGLVAHIDTSAWQTPELFNFIQSTGQIETAEMFRAFNMGVGYIVVTDESHAADILAATDGFVIGQVAKSTDNKKVKLCHSSGV